MPRHSLVPTALIVSLLCPGCFATPKARRKVGTGLLIGGAAVAVVGFAVSHSYSSDESCSGGSGYAPDDCFLPALAGAVVGMSGVGAVAFGTGSIISGWLEEAREEEARGPHRTDVARVQGDESACVAWQSSYDAERDPGRRQVLVASRPGHCAPPLAPPSVQP